VALLHSDAVPCVSIIVSLASYHTCYQTLTHRGIDKFVIVGKLGCC